MGMRDVKVAKQETKITTPESRDHFKKVSDDRFENDLQEIEAAVRRVHDRREEPVTEEWRERMNRIPSESEVVEQMKKMRDSSRGEDGVRLSYLMKGGDARGGEDCGVHVYGASGKVGRWLKDGCGGSSVQNEGKSRRSK